MIAGIWNVNKYFFRLYSLQMMFLKHSFQTIHTLVIYSSFYVVPMPVVWSVVIPLGKIRSRFIPNSWKKYLQGNKENTFYIYMSQYLIGFSFKAMERVFQLAKLKRYCVDDFCNMDGPETRTQLVLFLWIDDKTTEATSKNI